MILIIIITVIIAVLIVFFSFFFYSRRNKRKIKEAMRHESAGRYHEALAIYDYLLNLGYSPAETRWKIANTAYHANIIQRAEKELTVLIETKDLPENVSMFAVKSLMVECYLKLGKIKEAFVELVSLFKLAPDNPLLLFELAKIYAGQRKTNRAIELFEKCHRHNPKDHEVLYYLARAYLDYGDAEKALEYMENTARLKYFDRGKVNYYLGILYYSKKRYNEALSNFTQVLKLKLNDNRILAEAHHLIAHCYKEKGLIDEAITNFEKSQTYSELIPGDAQGKTTLYNEGVLLYKSGHYKKALEKFYKLKMIDYKYKDVDQLIRIIGTRMKSGEELSQNVANYISENPLFNILKRGILYSNVRFNIDAIEKEAEKYAGSIVPKARSFSYNTVNKLNEMTSRDFKDLSRKLVHSIGYHIKSEPRFYGDTEYIDGDAINFYAVPLKNLKEKDEILMTIRRYKDEVPELAVGRFIDWIEEKGIKQGVFITSALFSPQAIKVIHMNPNVKFIDKNGFAKMLGRI
ncbi:MAG: tetratricopeptide repeat protein [Candidatus Lokiarchaeota archaeon]|nr:tetratricopeptide repeat protein [Candidatus Lokiarchaeota archaeon]